MTHSLRTQEEWLNHSTPLAQSCRGPDHLSDRFDPILLASLFISIIHIAMQWVRNGGNPPSINIVSPVLHLLHRTSDSIFLIQLWTKTYSETASWAGIQTEIEYFQVLVTRLGFVFPYMERLLITSSNFMFKCMYACMHARTQNAMSPSMATS